jgi:hypothetical protein
MLEKVLVMANEVKESKRRGISGLVFAGWVTR